MRNVTPSADAELIDQARRRAEREQSTLNQAFRGWLREYASGSGLTVEDIRRLVEPVSQFRAGRRFTRDERNTR